MLHCYCIVLVLGHVNGNPFTVAFFQFIVKCEGTEGTQAVVKTLERLAGLHPPPEA